MATKQTIHDLDKRLSVSNLDRGIETFASYWKVAVEVVGEETVHSYFETYEKGYGNVAILTDGFIIDVEGDDEDGTGVVGVFDLRRIDSVGLLQGPVDFIEDTNANSLTLVTNLTDEPSGPWWTTDDEAEKATLRRFAKAALERLKEIPLR